MNINNIYKKSLYNSTATNRSVPRPSGFDTCGLLYLKANRLALPACQTARSRIRQVAGGGYLEPDLNHTRLYFVRTG
jgi:hypothetical protein